MFTPEHIAAAKAAYDASIAAQQAARAIIETLKATSADTIIAYENAKKAYEALKPSQALAKAKLQRADADVIIARAEWHAVSPESASKKGIGNASLFLVVKAFLADKPNGANNQDIYDALVSGGVEMVGADPRSNLNSYLSRWASAGALVDKGKGKWGVVTPVFPSAPSFLPVEPVAAPAFLAPSVDTSDIPIADPDELGRDFPGVEALSEAGIANRSELVGKSQEDLVSIPGIGAKTAGKILAALAV